MTKRLILAFLALWVLILVVPGFRERAQPRLQEAGAWTWARMEGPLSPVTDRYRRVQAESDLSEMSRLMTIARNEGRRPPEQRDFAEFLKRHEIAPEGLDPWGTPYLIQQEADSVALTSAGPDLQYGTNDDLVVRVRFRRR